MKDWDSPEKPSRWLRVEALLIGLLIISGYIMLACGLL